MISGCYFSLQKCKPASAWSSPSDVCDRRRLLFAQPLHPRLLTHIRLVLWPQLYEHCGSLTHLSHMLLGLSLWSIILLPIKQLYIYHVCGRRKRDPDYILSSSQWLFLYKKVVIPQKEATSCFQISTDASYVLRTSVVGRGKNVERSLLKSYHRQSSAPITPLLLAYLYVWPNIPVTLLSLWDCIKQIDHKLLLTHKLRMSPDRVWDWKQR